MSATPATIIALGAGRMGRGIAHAFAYAGHPVWLLDIKPRTSEAFAALREEALAEIDASLHALADWGMFERVECAGVIHRIQVAGLADAPAVLAAADIVFEGVPELIEAKRTALDLASQYMRPDAILASTTSTHRVTELAALCRQPARFLNAHWLNPAPIIPLVELSVHAGTDPAVIARMRTLLERMGKVPVLCSASAGYLVPRLQTLVMNEAARMIEEVVATAEDIDRATRYGFGFRYAAMGLVEFMDYGGNDILYHASRYLARELGPRYEAPEIINRFMHEGRLGLKTGSGFFDYSTIDEPAYRKEALGRILAMLRHQGLVRPPGSAL